MKTFFLTIIAFVIIAGSVNAQARFVMKSTVGTIESNGTDVYQAIIDDISGYIEIAGQQKVGSMYNKIQIRTDGTRVGTLPCNATFSFNSNGSRISGSGTVTLTSRSGTLISGKFSFSDNNVHSPSGLYK